MGKARQYLCLSPLKNVELNDQDTTACKLGGLSAVWSCPDAGGGMAKSAKMEVKGLNGRKRRCKAAGAQVFCKRKPGLPLEGGKWKLLIQPASSFRDWTILSSAPSGRQRSSIESAKNRRLTYR